MRGTVGCVVMHCGFGCVLAGVICLHLVLPYVLEPTGIVRVMLIVCVLLWSCFSCWCVLLFRLRGFLVVVIAI